MIHTGEDPWPPEDIDGMLREMDSDANSSHWPRVRAAVYQYAKKYEKRPPVYLDDAEDLAGDVMVILVTPGQLEAFDNRDSPYSRRAFLKWLAIITHRAWVSRARYYQARPVTEPLDKDGNNDDAPHAQIADMDADVERIVELHELIDGLRQRLQEIWQLGGGNAEKVLRYQLGALAGLRHKEVARRCGCQPAQVRMAVHEIRKEILDLLQNYRLDATPSTHRKQRKGLGTSDQSSKRSQRAKRPKRPKRGGRAPATDETHPQQHEGGHEHD